jgi:site-specific recombinase XerD
LPLPPNPPSFRLSLIKAYSVSAMQLIPNQSGSFTNPNSKLIGEYFANACITGALSDSSMLKYKDSIRKFLSLTGCKFIGDLDNRDFDIFILKMRANGASGSRIRNVISAVKSLINYLQKEGLIGTGLDLEKIRKPKAERKDVSFLTIEEIKIFLEAIRSDIEAGVMIRKVRMMALVMLLLQTGARVGEALSIKVKDIDRLNMEIPIIGKGKKPRSLYIKNETLYWIDRYLSIRKSQSDFLFVTLNGQEPWQQTDVGRSFRLYKKKSGISKPFVLHTLRHTTATQLTLKGVPMNSVQHILGHTRLETTIRYYIGAIEKKMAKQVMRDEYYSFIPKDAINSASPQNSNTGGAPSLPAPCPRPNNIYR